MSLKLYLMAAVYVVLSVLLGLIAAYLGFVIARRITSGLVGSEEAVEGSEGLRIRMDDEAEAD